jgi:carbohydrate binding protein with CBM4/9 domain/parallel beta helix pectate lyase-like protein
MKRQTSSPRRLVVSALGLVMVVFAAGGALVLTRLIPVRASQVAYYVSSTGSDANPGTQAAPFATISHAISLATAPGTTVHVGPGTYSASTLAIPQSGIAGEPISIISDVKWGAKIADSSWHAWYVTGSYITIEGFETYMTNPANASAIVELGKGANYVSIVGNYVHDADNTPGAPCLGGAGIDIYGGTGARVIGNRIANIGIGCNQMHGIYSGQNDAYFANNIISNIAGDGIVVWPQGDHATVVNNDVSHINQDGISIGAASATTDPVGSGSADYAFVANNSVRGVAHYGIREYGNAGVHNVYTNNNVIAAGLGSYYLLNGLTAQHPMSYDPQYVNWVSDGSGDYQLHATSPLIDAGTTQDAPNTAFDGTARPQGTGIDIGAYEYVPPTTSSTATPTPVTTPAGGGTNLLQNGSFAVPAWTFKSDGQATFATDANTTGTGSGMITVPVARTCDCAVQLYQSPVVLTAGHNYTLTFSARASVTRSIRPAVLHAISPWTNYFSRSTNLTTSWQQFTFTFVAPASDSDAAVLFNLGAATGIVWIDNVELSS